MSNDTRFRATVSMRATQALAETLLASLSDTDAAINPRLALRDDTGRTRIEFERHFPTSVPAAAAKVAAENLFLRAGRQSGFSGALDFVVTIRALGDQPALLEDAATAIA